MELLVFLVLSGVIGGGIPAAVIFFKTRAGTLTRGASIAMAITEIVIGLIDIAAGWYGYKAATQPHAGEGGLLTLFFMLVGLVGLTVGPLLLLAGTLQIAKVRPAYWFQCIILGLYVLFLSLPILFSF